jgi:hypothetical protein
VAAVRGGGMHTGDGGYMDPNGHVFNVDRIKDMTVTGGENVYRPKSETPSPSTAPSRYGQSSAYPATTRRTRPRRCDGASP